MHRSRSLLDEAVPGQAYAIASCDAPAHPAAQSPVCVTLRLKISSVVAKSAARGTLLPNRSAAFLSALAAPPINCDADSQSRALGATLDLARRYRPSARDAS
jgi:hypothetical protein